MPKLSVITINYNDAAGLEKTIQSVVAQTVTDFEFIVIDGGSSDSSVDLLKKYAQRISFWSSEKDNGIYDAQNKGVSKANGEYLIFLNAGDCFYNDFVVEKFYAFVEKHNPKVIYGNSNVVNADGSSYVLTPPDLLDLNFWYANTLNHQAVFFNSSLFKQYGLFSTHYKYVSDFEHLFKIYVKEPSGFYHFDTVVCNYDNTGITSKDEFHQLIIQERKQIIKTNVSRDVFLSMRAHYLQRLTFSRRCITVIRETPFLKGLLKPFYQLFKLFVK